MTDRNFIPAAFLPTCLPMNGTALWLLVLDRFNAPAWLFAVYITLAVLVWAALIWYLKKSEPSKAFEVWFKTLNDTGNKR